ncbi:MAG: hypothetical protein ACO1OF_10150 [Adhaeribacter sp.]
MVTLISFDLPEGWGQAGSKPNSYEMGIAKGAGHDGKNAATIKSIEKDIDGFGTLMQSSSPEEYLGKRVKMSGYVKSENVTKRAGLWLRVDQAGSNQALSFDNMHNRSIKGTTGWKKYEVVLDVPENASNLAYGALLNGTGQIWFDNLTFEIVDKSVKTTGMINNGKSVSPNKPTNLNFDN